MARFDGDPLAEGEDDALEDEDGSGGVEQRQRLARAQRVDDAADAAGAERLDGGQVVVGGLAEQAAERDDRRQRRKVQEHDAGQTLDVKRVRKVRFVPGRQTR